MSAFGVDLVRLDLVVAEMTEVERLLVALDGDLVRQMATLHAQWTGLAATAQAAAHEEWSEGLRAMHAALAELRAVARTAHGNYSRAAETNLAMWRSAT